ncbi:T-cell receptor alpha chain V region RL-5 [Takifugu flavidus]|nr:T-cell receptor alpha chain V region RL-5 [Takifugu flavidus]
MAAEDQTVTLDCNYTSTVTDVNIFWYKQDGTSRPQFILSRFTFGKGTTEDEFKERFSSTLNPTMKSAPLKIQELQLSDSAVYYCALRPTVTGSSRKCRGEDKVMQPPEDVVAAEGDTVTLDCTFQTSDPSPTCSESAPLKIQELQLSDSAVYYCALRPTVTGSSRSAH